MFNMGRNRYTRLVVWAAKRDIGMDYRKRISDLNDALLRSERVWRISSSILQSKMELVNFKICLFQERLSYSFIGLM